MVCLNYVGKPQGSVRKYVGDSGCNDYKLTGHFFFFSFTIKLSCMKKNIPLYCTIMLKYITITFIGI